MVLAEWLGLKQLVPWTARVWIDEPRTPQHSARFPDAGQPSTLWRSGADAWANDRAGATPRPDSGDAGRQRVRCRGVLEDHAGLLPRCRAGPETVRGGRPRQAAAPAPGPGLDASDAAGVGSGFARRAVRFGQPGVLVPRRVQSAPSPAQREAPAPGRGFAQH